MQDAYAAALERDTLQGYEDFLAAYPGDPLAKRVRAIVAARREAITWRRTYRTDTPQAYWSYLRRYPRGPHAGDARRRLAILTAPLEPPPSFAMIDYDVPPPPPDEIVYVDRPVLYFGDPDFDFAPPPPPPVFFLPPPPPDFVVLAPPLAADRAVRPAAAVVRADAGLCPGAGLCRAAAEQHHLQQHPQHDRHQQRHQPATGAGCASGTGHRGWRHRCSRYRRDTRYPTRSVTAAAKGEQGTVTPANVGPTLPHTAMTKAALIQDEKLPPPPSTIINGTAKSAGIANVQSGQKGTTANTVQTNATSGTLPADKTLPGMKRGHHPAQGAEPIYSRRAAPAPNRQRRPR